MHFETDDGIGFQGFSNLLLEGVACQLSFCFGVHRVLKCVVLFAAPES